MSAPGSYSLPNAVRSTSSGTSAYAVSAGAAISPMIANARPSTGRGSRPAASRCSASGSSHMPIPAAIQTSALAATVAAA
jgi:hypothetical protein